MKVVVCLLVAVMPLSAVSLVNGSFEDLDSSYVNDAGTDQDNGNLAPGWMTIDSPDWFWGEGPENLWDNPEGDYFVIGAAEGFREGVRQEVSGFVVGGMYELSFWQANGLYYVGSYFGVNMTGGWEVFIDGVSVDTFDSANPNNAPALEHTSDWLERTLEFEATGETLELTFLAYKNPQITEQGPTFQFLDGVRVSAVPEPGAGVLVGLALVGGFLRRKRNGGRGRAAGLGMMVLAGGVLSGQGAVVSVAGSGSISTLDLINTGSADLAGVSYGVGWTPSGINDGTIGLTAGYEDSDGHYPSVNTFDLDTVTNPGGYHISEIVTVAALGSLYPGIYSDWHDQHILIEYSTIYLESYVPLVTLDVTGAEGSINGTWVSVTEPGFGAYLATEVDSLRFTILKPGGEDMNSISEIDVFGRPSPVQVVPEPGVVFLVGISALLGVGRRRG